MKNKILAKICPVIITLLILSTTIQVQAADGWEEDFEDETILTLEEKGWVFKAYEKIADIWYQVNDHGCDVIDGILRAPDSLNRDNFTAAFRESTTAYGTWKFDWAPAITPPGIAYYDLVWFIVDRCQINNSDTLTEDEPLTAYQLWIHVSNAGEVWRIGLDKHYTGANYTNIDLHTITPITGPIHIEITRDTEGHFKVYLNEGTTPIIEGTDNEITESTLFQFGSLIGNSGIDNITVDNTTIEPGTTIPGFPVGFVICTVTPTLIVLVIRRRRNILKNR